MTKLHISNEEICRVKKKSTTTVQEDKIIQFNNMKKPWVMADHSTFATIAQKMLMQSQASIMQLTNKYFMRT